MKAETERVFWNLTDQAFSSFSAAALVFLVAREVSAETFGVFSMGFAIYVFMHGMNKVLLSIPYIIATSGKDGLHEGRQVAWLTILFGLSGTLVLFLVGLWLRNDYTLVLWAFGAGMPVLMLQDFWRMVLISKSRPDSAAANDILWFLSATAALVYSIMSGMTEPWQMISAWLVGPTLGVLLGLKQTRMIPIIAGSWVFLRNTWWVSKWIFGETSMFLVSQQLMWILVPAAVGPMRGGMSLLGPLNSMSLATNNWLLSELCRDGRPEPHRARKLVRRTAVALAVLSVGWGSVLLVMPDSWGRIFLGDTWSVAKTTVLGIMVWFVAQAASNPPHQIIRSHENTRPGFVVHLWFCPIMIGFAVIGNHLAGPAGAAMGYGLSATVFAPVWWWLGMHRTLKGNNDEADTEQGSLEPGRPRTV